MNHQDFHRPLDAKRILQHDRNHRRSICVSIDMYIVSRVDSVEGVIIIVEVGTTKKFDNC